MKATPVLWLVLVILWPAGNASAQNDYRTWTSRDGNHTLEAQFDDYDAKSKIVTLVSLDKQAIEVPWNQLSRQDQRLITSIRKSNETGSHGESTSTESPFKKSPKKKERKPGKRIGTTSRFGLDWTPGLENALVSAAGNEGSQDDKPVMWFRVLGQLDGDM